MGITKSGTRVILEYQAGDPFGNTDDPFNYDRVADAIVDNGWTGLYARKGDSIIFEDISIYIEGSETAFVDLDYNAIFTGDTDDIYYMYITSVVPKCELSNIVHDAKGYNNFPSFVDDSGVGYFDKLVFYKHYRVRSNSEFNGCTFKGVFTIEPQTGTIIKNCTMVGNRSCTIFGTPEIDGLYIFEHEIGILFNGRYADQDIVVNKVLIEDCDEDMRFTLGYDSYFTVTLDDCKLNSDNYGIGLYSSSGGITKVERKTFNTNIQNSTGGTLTITDKDGNEVYSEVLTSDKMTEQKIEYDRLYLENTDGVLTAEERTIKEPFTLTVTKTGYQDLIIPNIYATELQDDGSRVGTLSAKVVSGGMEQNPEPIEFTLKDDLSRIFEYFNEGMDVSETITRWGKEKELSFVGMINDTDTYRITYQPATDDYLIEQYIDGSWQTVTTINSGDELVTKSELTAKPKYRDREIKGTIEKTKELSGSIQVTEISGKIE